MAHIGADPTKTPHRWLRFDGRWQKAGAEIAPPHGYYEWFYWGGDGQYLGPDADGVEPVYCEYDR